VGLKEMVKGETLLGGWIWDEKEPLKEGWGEKGFSPLPLRVAGGKRYKMGGGELKNSDATGTG
jgi:hypothetical protein